MWPGHWWQGFGIARYAFVPLLECHLTKRTDRVESLLCHEHMLKRRRRKKSLIEQKYSILPFHTSCKSSMLAACFQQVTEFTLPFCLSTFFLKLHGIIYLIYTPNWASIHHYRNLPSYDVSENPRNVKRVHSSYRKWKDSYRCTTTYLHDSVSCRTRADPHCDAGTSAYTCALNPPSQDAWWCATGSAARSRSVYLWSNTHTQIWYQICLKCTFMWFVLSISLSTSPISSDINSTLPSPFIVVIFIVLLKVTFILINIDIYCKYLSLCVCF